MMYDVHDEQVCPSVKYCTFLQVFWGGGGSASLLLWGTMVVTTPALTLPIERSPCSENELTSCSLQVLSVAGSPGRTLLARLADRSCPLDFLLHCLRKIDHQEAVHYLTTKGKAALFIYLSFEQNLC